ncbi:unnamed protein product [Parascedosporium putredinis]|uniref:polynucleotide adenylyltransferase n=1 Tax=Parascedosporium putredinis TaxID=1442378 RepID=A0A9P1M7S6_9PEZI|nr:unnamed protein product [Parascedosporium putredinis]CAI7992275.1 unnamed protein product [Parascedosporium putredinis]
MDSYRSRNGRRNGGGGGGNHGQGDNDNYRQSDDRYSKSSQSYGASDSYRPDFRPPRGDFTFRVANPAGILPYRLRLVLRAIEGGPAVIGTDIVAATPIPSPVVLGGDDTGAQYKDVDQLTDDEEHDMEISDSDASQPAQPSSKRARRQLQVTDTDANVPKWSNPDPYTALPPPDPSQRKKVDVVQLIRKARVEADEDTPKPLAELDEFISFGGDSDRSDESETDDRGRIPSRASKASSITDRDFGDTLGTLILLVRESGRGGLTPEWVAPRGQDPCPWAVVDHSATRQMGAWLHKEVMDFYEHFRPRQFEQDLRQKLVSHLDNSMKRGGNFSGCEIKAFGSFMSGLYLPLSDMDLVVCSYSLLRTGRETQRCMAKSFLYRFRRFLETDNIPFADSTEVIAKARVPLVKYVDRLTGLKVDVSFENTSGINAIDTFLVWRKQFPSMPILVTVVKQFLVMRGLNEPVNGGIGGFTVICLVVSLLQLMPQVQSRNMIPEHHLGEILLEFFDLYGNRFNYEEVAIRMTPPGYVPKHKVQNFPYRNLDRLSIIDPNNSSNDISGGGQDVRLTTQDGKHSPAYPRGNYSPFETQREFMRQLYEKTYGACSEDAYQFK